MTDVALEKEIESIHDNGNAEQIGEEVQRTATASSELPHAFKLFSIMLALALSIFLVSLDMTIVATAIPKITDEFHSLQDVGWYGSR